MPRVPHSLVLAYTVSLAAVALAAAAKLLLQPLFETGTPFLLFFTAVMVSGWYGGLGPGLLASALSALLANYLFLPPYRSLEVETFGHGVRLLIFVLECALISVLTEMRLRQAERARAQGEWLRVTLGSIGDAVIATDTGGRITLMNRVAQALTGWSIADALDRPVREVLRMVNEATRAVVESPVDTVLREGQVVGLASHTLLIARDGSETPIDDSGAQIKDDQGHLLGAVLVFRDISASKRAEQQQAHLAAQVARERERLNTIIANIPGVVWEAWGQPDAANQRIDFVSSYVETMLGYSVSEWLETPNFWLQIVHPDDRSRASSRAAEIFAGGVGGANQFRWLAKDGRAVWVEAQASVIRDADARPIGMRGVALDISEIKRAEEERNLLLARERAARAEAEAARERLDFLAHASTLLSSSLDYEGTLASLARLAVPRLADWCVVDMATEDGPPHRLAVEHIDPAKVALARDLQRRYPADPDAPHGVARVLRTRQPELIAEITDELAERVARDAEHLAIIRALGLRSYMIVPLIARDRTLGAISFVAAESGRGYGPADLALAQDLAARAATAVDNAQLYRAARDAIRARDQFLSIASHELKTPLTSLMGFAELLQRRTARDQTLGERDQRTLRMIVGQAQRLHQLVIALLDISRIQGGQLSIERRPVDLAGLVRRQVEAMQPMLDRHTLALDAPDQALIIMGDELRLEQVLQNVLQNAIKYSPDGGQIDVRVARRGARACVDVADRGIGIPSAALPLLFHRFYRAPNADEQQIGGMGIGLFVVKEIVGLHGGEVEVVSREGQGSTFTICLPSAAADQPQT